MQIEACAGRAALALRWSLLAFGLGVLAGCAGPSYPPAPVSAATPDYRYVIGPLDTVSIIVWRNPELSLSVPVRPDGKITTPLVEDLPAEFIVAERKHPAIGVVNEDDLLRAEQSL